MTPADKAPNPPSFSTRNAADPAFWDERFEQGFTPWDMRGVPEEFRQFISGKAPCPTLVPGCGNGWEAGWLFERGWPVTAIDFSPQAVASARRALGPAGAIVRFRVRARDVALAVGYPGLISIRNRLAGRVTAIHDTEPPGVEVHLDVAGEHLVAAITRDATYALELAVGQPVTALVKATALDRFSFGSEGSAQAARGD